jgi:hypothetical protein
MLISLYGTRWMHLPQIIHCERISPLQHKNPARYEISIHHNHFFDSVAHCVSSAPLIHGSHTPTSTSSESSPMSLGQNSQLASTSKQDPFYDYEQTPKLQHVRGSSRTLSKSTVKLPPFLVLSQRLKAQFLTAQGLLSDHLFVSASILTSKVIYDNSY